MILYQELLPAETELQSGRPLNLLLLVKSDVQGDFPLRLWTRGSEGPAAAGWTPALCETRPLRADHTEHLYFQLPAEAIPQQEEFLLYAGDCPPASDQPGSLCRLLFVRG